LHRPEDLFSDELGRAELLERSQGALDPFAERIGIGRA
jgi:hypothetical protein